MNSKALFTAADDVDLGDRKAISKRVLLEQYKIQPKKVCFFHELSQCRKV